MPKSVTKRRSRFAVLTVVAVIASLFVIPAAPASAAVKPADKALFTACPADVIPSAGFGDTTGSFALGEIDCLAYYGVTKGTATGVYSPAQVVTRWQMALFLIRAAGPAGVTIPTASDQGFKDLAGLSAEAVDAINQLAALDIAKGTSTTTFSPNDPVSRYQMALFLARFLGKAKVGPGGFGDYSGTQKITGTGNDFTDLGNVTVEAFNAIEDLFHGGVTTGTTATTFSPFAAVTREQMAAFITRTLAHTNARPAGVNIQASPTSGFSPFAPAVAVSYRDTSFMPMSNMLIDVFQRFTAAGATEKAALKSDGTCDITGAGLTAVSTGANVCQIDLTDFSTDGNGNVLVGAAVPVGTGETTWWAWSATTGTKFDADVNDVSAAKVTETAAATTWKVTTTIPKNAEEDNAGNGNANLVKYGTTVTHTFQLSDGTNNVAQAGRKIDVLVSTYVGGALQSTDLVKLTSDANGTINASFTQSDPSSTADNDSGVYFSFVSLDGLGADLSKVPNTNPNIMWDDDASTAEMVELKSVNPYVEASDTGSGATNTVQATVYDQYGLGLSGISVDFTSDDNDGIGGTDVTRTTGAGGVASLSYNRDSAAAGIEDVDADAGAAGTDTVDVYWVKEAPADYDNGGTAVVIADATGDAIVFIDGTPWVAYYDANDQFKIDGATATFENFDKEVAKTLAGDEIIITDYKTSASGISQFDWDN